MDAMDEDLARSNVTDQVRETLARYGSLAAGETVVLGVSGGPTLCACST